ncbi:TetR/AcrR family transcriptional regulator [Paraliomyxa miuraensis]|uniref:TetR/AcrR family transcriptional regulator n=1 Tax=Paraliomyxa miuraensis TaxID=376150 RepID=UPI002258B227|nr:TetR/AcrR family transcriptional regulator [Paraliomyxa miuraensis]MCX4246914.1 TetR/AcrR family transcriptional regulator [Paraliomyxa miuraensis]
MPRAARKAQLVTRTREAILDAATTAFAQQGYHAVTVKDIASAAGYTAPSLYNYFGSKEEIFAALLERIHVAFIALFDEPVPAGLTFAQRLELLLHRHVDVRARHADAFAVFMKLQTGAMPNEALARWKLQGVTAYLDRLTRWVAESATEDELSPYGAEALAFHLWGSMIADYTRVLLERGAESDPQQHIQRIVDLFLYGAKGRSSCPEPER